MAAISIHPMATTPLYQSFAEDFRSRIEAGVYRPGDRLPSIRRLSDEGGVSINTVKAALRLLEDWRLIEVRPQSGHFVLGRPGFSRELPNEVVPAGGACVVEASVAARLNAALRAGGQPTLGAAVQSPELMPARAVERLFRKVLRDEPTLCHSYDAPPGVEALRKAIARRGPEAGYAVGPEEVVITGGAKEAVYLSIKCVAPPGSVVAVQSPGYYALLEVLGSLGLKAVEVASHPVAGLNLDHLDHVLCKYDVAAVAIVSNFSNPTGSVMPDEAKAELVATLRRYDVPLVEDDVYGDLPFRPPRPKAVKAFDEDGRVLYCGSFSKTISPGLRLGWVLPGRYAERLRLLKLVLNQSTAVAPQLVAAAFLESGEYDRHLRRLRARFQEQMEDAARAVASCFPADVRMTRPEGGHVLWVELPRGVDSLALYERAAAEGIQFAPGPIFSPTGAFRNYVRLNTGFPWDVGLQRQATRLGELIAEAL